MSRGFLSPLVNFWVISAFNVCSEASNPMKRRAFVAISLAACLLALPGVSSTTKSKESDEAKRQANLFQKKLNKDDQILHPLNRFTFSPPPAPPPPFTNMRLTKWLPMPLH